MKNNLEPSLFPRKTPPHEICEFDEKQLRTLAFSKNTAFLPPRNLIKSLSYENILPPQKWSKRVKKIIVCYCVFLKFAFFAFFKFHNFWGSSGHSKPSFFEKKGPKNNDTFFFSVFLHNRRKGICIGLNLLE